MYLSKEVVVQEKDASEAQEDTQHHSNTRATCKHAALFEEALIRRAGDTPREHHLPSPPPPPHTKAHASRAHMHTYKRTHTHMRMEGRGHAKGASPPPHIHTQML